MSATTTSGLKPAMTPPAGEITDFDTTDNLYNWNIVTQVVCLTTTSIFMAVRSTIRLGILKKWNLEDWLCIASWLFFLSYSSIVSFVMTHHGGIHGWNLTRGDVMQVLYWNNVAQIVYSMSILTTKVSLLYLYLGIFAPTKRSKNWWTVVIIMIANIGFYTGLMFAKIFQCWPRDAIWDKTITTAKCVSLVGILDASGTWNTLSDVTILLVPLLFIWKLKLSREKRVGIITIFAVGVIAPIFSIVGVVVRIRTSASPDLSYYQPRLLFFAEAEITSGIICTCLPSLPRLYRYLRDDLPSTSSRSVHSRTKSQSYYNEQRRRRTLMRAQASTSSGKGFFSTDYVELDDNIGERGIERDRVHDGLGRGGVERPERVVVTDIRGGRDRGSGRGHGMGLENMEGWEAARNEVEHGGIWKTTEVRVQSESVSRNGAESEGSASGSGSIHPLDRVPGQAI